MNEIIEVLQPEIVKSQIAEVEKSAGLAQDAALALRNEFKSYYQEIVTWREKAALITKPDDSTHQKIARDVRLGLRKIRCEVEATRKALKADSLARGKAIDGFANVLKYLCEPIEEKLMAVEQYVERQEAARIAAIVADRVAVIAAEGADPSAYNLGAMDDSTFDMVVAGIRKIRKDAEEAARKAEAERVAKEQAEAAERERIKKENEKLRAEQAKVEAERKKERDAAAAKLREAEASAKAERDAREKAEREASEAKQKEEARIKAEKAAAEAKLIEDRKAAVKAMRAPDKNKIVAFANALREFPVMAAMATEDGKRVANFVLEKRAAFAEWIIKQAETL